MKLPSDTIAAYVPRPYISRASPFNYKIAGFHNSSAITISNPVTSNAAKMTEHGGNLSHRQVTDAACEVFSE